MEKYSQYLKSLGLLSFIIIAGFVLQTQTDVFSKYGKYQSANVLQVSSDLISQYLLNGEYLSDDGVDTMLFKIEANLADLTAHLADLEIQQSQINSDFSLIVMKINDLGTKQSIQDKVNKNTVEINAKTKIYTETGKQIKDKSKECKKIAEDKRTDCDNQLKNFQSKYDLLKSEIDSLKNLNKTLASQAKSYDKTITDLRSQETRLLAQKGIIASSVLNAKATKIRLEDIKKSLEESVSDRNVTLKECNENSINQSQGTYEICLKDLSMFQNIKLFTTNHDNNFQYVSGPSQCDQLRVVDVEKESNSEVLSTCAYYCADGYVYSDGKCIVANCDVPSATNYNAGAEANDYNRHCEFQCSYDSGQALINSKVGTYKYAVCNSGWSETGSKDGMPAHDGSFIFDGSCHLGSEARDNSTCKVGCSGSYVYDEETNDCVLKEETKEGCTDPGAANYDSYANTDNGSCSYGVSGCTDANATNYNANATTDDYSCEYI